MDKSAETLARAIGERVKQERKGRGWTLDQLAETAGISRRMLVNVEQGGVNPSIGTLLRLSDALGVGLPALVEPPAPRPVRVTRSGQGAVLWTGASGGRAVLVAGTGSPDVVELWDWTLEAGEQHASEAHSAGTRELLQVLEGSLTVSVDGEVHELDTGDAMTFFGDVPHAYSNSSRQSTRFALTVFEPGVGTAHRTENSNA
ncbi:helix-turn-helix domain-containing protein [Paenarthrobacter ilicis]|uniref:Transcriptional regulator with XRE-family HTH domain n=1 Tax=Paenarthrobacter ilicis TaxID=43665 RepID=A0ABX0TPJ0_9MICC|nr:XRE family transcriptional regulator [Paenarthrobacter ilicis]MBM7791478.1 transcriptional regulator with XRE-family HTH domain [Paenarthrobacter ilicis]NIJ02746.1 transcriptional regulator with XRE-family HTH domain [Paenarthrobacter ilicis]